MARPPFVPMRGGPAALPTGAQPPTRGPGVTGLERAAQVAAPQANLGMGGPQTNPAAPPGPVAPTLPPQAAPQAHDALARAFGGAPGGVPGGTPGAQQPGPIPGGPLAGMNPQDLQSQMVAMLVLQNLFGGDRGFPGNVGGGFPGQGNPFANF